jgi:hypothetical protein
MKDALARPSFFRSGAGYTHLLLDLVQTALGATNGTAASIVRAYRCSSWASTSE